jgi:hypothetical protein
MIRHGRWTKKELRNQQLCMYVMGPAGFEPAAKEL